MVATELKKIKFHYVDASFFFPFRTLVKEAILKLFRNEGFKVASVDYVFCNDTYLLKLNKKHLNHNTLTDIITFQYSEPAQPISSDIFISVERVKENAQLYQCPFLNELQRVIFHGALHLCGYTDKQEEDIQTMRAKENFYLRYVPRETKF